VFVLERGSFESRRVGVGGSVGLEKPMGRRSLCLINEKGTGSGGVGAVN